MNRVEPGGRDRSTPENTSGPRKALAWMALAQVLFTIMGVCTRLGAQKLPWSEVAAARAVLGAIVAIGVARMRGVPLVIHDRRTSWARSICGTVAMICTFYAFGAPAIALGDAVTLGATSPIFIAILAPWLLGERSGPIVWVATTIAFAGVALVAGPSLKLSGALSLVSLLGAAASALAMIWLRRLGTGRSGAPRESPEAIVAHFSLVAGVTLSLVALPTLRVPDLEGALFLLGTGASGAFAQIAMTRAYALDRAARVGVWSYLGVVLTHFAAIGILGEREDPIGLAGSALVIAAGVGLTWSGLREARAAAVVASPPCQTVR
ncbi:DMT family transporter [Polyangium sp. 6x1]|uniref:DMT family transporter n=1 Tax=Polyangium sp. 6x1 TaxID=3042689 RepID=UPI002482BA0D|nr:DMT family transporter [Polyangium sp. 6x1]MDI1450252.1 DMT family transporter [Polyangium sp. 6x1]